MKYNEKDNRISALVYQKYTNPILPILPFILSYYLMHNPDKLSLYVNDELTLEDVLSKLHDLINGNNIDSILETIIKCVEGDNSV